MKTDNTKTEKLIEQYGDSGYAVINKSTGEYYSLPVLSKTILPPDKEQVKYKQTHIMKFLSSEVFVKMFKLPIFQLMQCLSYRDFTWFIGLLMFVNKEDNILMYEGEYLNIKRISELFSVNYDNMRKAFKTYLQNELVYKGKAPSLKNANKIVNVLIVNPFVVFNGKNICENTYNLSSHSSWAKLYDEVKE